MQASRDKIICPGSKSSVHTKSPVASDMEEDSPGLIDDKDNTAEAGREVLSLEGALVDKGMVGVQHYLE